MAGRLTSGAHMGSTKMITIADWLLIAVTFTGPIVAVQVQKWVERIREKRNRKHWIFHTLMATRAIRAGSNEHRHSGTAVAQLIAIFGEGLSVDYNKITPTTIIIYALRER